MRRTVGRSKPVFCHIFLKKPTEDSCVCGVDPKEESDWRDGDRDAMLTVTPAR